MKKLILAVAIAAVNSSAQAAPANPRLEEMIVTASRVQTPLRVVGASVSVMTDVDLEMRGQTNLADSLRTLPSVNVTRTGGPGGPTALRIRGEDGYRTLVLIDGVNISDPTGTQVGPQFEHINSYGIERVEVLRGSQGMMYGADAGGVVNISTRRAHEGTEGNATAEYGRYDSQLLAGNVAGKSGAFDYALQASDIDTEGFNARTDDSSRDDDGYQNTTLHGSAGFQFSEQWRAELTAREVEGEGDYDRCYRGAPTYDRSDDCTSLFKQSIQRAALHWDQNDLQQSLSYSMNDVEREYRTDNAFSYGTEGDIEEAQYLASVPVLADASIVAGVDYERQEADSGSGALSQYQTGAYAQWQHQLVDAFNYTLGLRNDDNSDYGDNMSYRATGAYVLALGSDELKLKSTWGTGFRAPSVFEVATNAAPWATPPASEVTLKEETSESFDAGFEYYFQGGALVELVYFEQVIADAIEYDMDFYSGYLQLNGESKSRGAEFSAELPLTAWFTLIGNYTYNEATDPDNQQRIRRPRNIANLGLRFESESGKLRLAVDYRRVADQVDLYGEPLADFGTVDLMLSYRLIETVELYSRVENALDEDYAESDGYNGGGAAVYGGVRLSF